MTLPENAAPSLPLRALGALLAFLTGVAAVTPSGWALDAGWQLFDAGDVSFEAPSAMRTPANDRATPERVAAKRPDWSFTLTDQPARPYRGITISFDWSKNVSVDASGTAVLSRGTMLVSGHRAARIDWRDDDAGWLGLDLVLRDVAPGGELFKVSCHSPAARWAEAKPLCERIAATLKFAGAPQKPPSPSSAGPSQGRRIAQTVDEPGLGFTLLVPQGWQFHHEAATDGETWSLRNDAWLRGEVPEEILSLTVSVIERTQGRDVEKEFRDFASSFAQKLLNGGRVESLGPRPFGSLSGFTAELSGTLQRQSAPAVPVRARLVLAESGNRHVLASAIAPARLASLLQPIGEPGGLFGPSAAAMVAGTPPGPTPPPLPGNTPGPTPPPPPVKPPAATVWAPPPAHEVLFSGRLDDRFEKLAVLGGDFDAFARPGPQGLAVDVPQGHSWGRTGVITSAAKPLFLDGLGDGVAQTLTLRFDAARTTAFRIMLSPSRDRCAKGQDENAIALVWAPKPNGGSTATFIATEGGFSGAAQGKQRFTAETGAASPGEVRITLSPGKAAVAIEGIEPMQGPFAMLHPSSALALCVFAEAPAENQPASMTLREIVIDRATSPNPAKPAATPELAAATLFGAKPRVEWDTAGLGGGDFAKFGQLRPGRLDVSVPAGNGWGSTGILSKLSVVSFDPFADEAPYRFRLKFDPQRTPGFVIELIGIHDWGWGRFIGQTGIVTGRAPGASGGRLFLNGCQGSDLGRPFPAQWSGDFEIVLRKDWYSVGVPDGPAIACQGSFAGAGRPAFLGLLSQAEKQDAASSFSLIEIKLDRVAPAGLKAAQRWKYLSDTDFDPATFEGEIQADLAGAAIDLPD
jgi:hypothetical protein